MNKIKTWKQGEFLAQNYLKKIGYKIVETNAKLAGAEVDIVAIKPKKLSIYQLKEQLDGGTIIKEVFNVMKSKQEDILVFVEVKARQGELYGLPQEAVNSNKQNHIKKFAKNYIKINNLYNMPVQFDVIAVLNDKIEHIENAF